MTVDQRFHSLDNMQDVLATIAYPLQYLVRFPTDAQRWINKHIVDRVALLEENAHLQERQLLLNAQLQRLTTVEAENRRLRALLESAVSTPERMLAAELLAVHFDPYRHHILLNRGRQHGVYVNQTVLDQHGLIGQIIDVDWLTATAILITDPHYVLPVQIDRTGMRTLAQGIGHFQQLELPHIPHNEDVKVGDLVITSGLGGRFPGGYPIAKISKVEFDPGSPFARIIARPVAQLDRIREVLLLAKNELDKPIDFTSKVDNAAPSP